MGCAMVNRCLCQQGGAQFPDRWKSRRHRQYQRAVANVTYRPLPNTRFALELGYGSVALDLPDRTNQLFIPSGQSLSLSLSTAVAF